MHTQMEMRIFFFESFDNVWVWALKVVTVERKSFAGIGIVIEIHRCFFNAGRSGSQISCHIFVRTELIQSHGECPFISSSN